MWQNGCTKGWGGGGGGGGGIVFDEMSIQPGIQLQPLGSGLDMFGYVDFGEGNSGIHSQQKGSGNLQLATSALQFVFLTLNGFRFPFSYMLNKGITAGQLSTIFWNIVTTLATFDFNIQFICMDGATSNRAMINMLCDNGTYVAQNLADIGSNISCIMDYSHVIKKIRNSIYASGPSTGDRRNIIHPSGPIYWQHFRDAYTWDCNNHYLRIHRKLTPEHLELNTSLKMRNHLAEQILNSDMLYLMRQYQKTLSDPSSVEGTVDLLCETSKLVEIFRSHMPLTSLEDERIDQLREVCVHFRDWNYFCKAQKDSLVTKKDIFITMESYNDLQTCINGFIALCEQCVDGTPIIPALVNSDVVENIFCQQRSLYRSASANPDASQYRYWMKLHYLLRTNTYNWTNFTSS